MGLMRGWNSLLAVFYFFVWGILVSSDDVPALLVNIVDNSLLPCATDCYTKTAQIYNTFFQSKEKTHGRNSCIIYRTLDILAFVNIKIDSDSIDNANVLHTSVLKYLEGTEHTADQSKPRLSLPLTQAMFFQEKRLLVYRRKDFWNLVENMEKMSFGLELLYDCSSKLDKKRHHDVLFIDTFRVGGNLFHDEEDLRRLRHILERTPRRISQILFHRKCGALESICSGDNILCTNLGLDQCHLKSQEQRFDQRTQQRKVQWTVLSDSSVEQENNRLNDGGATFGLLAERLDLRRVLMVSLTKSHRRLEKTLSVSFPNFKRFQDRLSLEIQEAVDGRSYSHYNAQFRKLLSPDNKPIPGGDAFWDHRENRMRFKSNPYHDHAYRGGVLGCAMSHLQIWYELAYERPDLNDSDAYLVLEDDASPSPFLNIEQENILESARVLRDDKEWNVIYLGGSDDFELYGEHFSNRSDISQNFSSESFQILKMARGSRSHGGGTVGYIIRKSGARIYLKRFHKFGMRQPVDWFMLKYISDGSINAYRFYPYIINENLTIAGNSTTKNAMPIDDELRCVENGADRLFTYVSFTLLIREPEIMADRENTESIYTITVPEDITIGVDLLVGDPDLFHQMHSCNRLCVEVGKGNGDFNHRECKVLNEESPAKGFNLQHLPKRQPIRLRAVLLASDGSVLKASSNTLNVEAIDRLNRFDATIMELSIDRYNRKCVKLRVIFEAVFREYFISRYKHARLCVNYKGCFDAQSLNGTTVEWCFPSEANQLEIKLFALPWELLGSTRIALGVPSKKLQLLAVHYRSPSIPKEAFENGYLAALKHLRINITYLDIGQWEGRQPDEIDYSIFYNHDMIFVKSNWFWVVDKFMRTHVPNCATPKALLISGTARPPELAEMMYYDLLVYETDWYEKFILSHPNRIQAFGIDTSVVKETTLPVYRDIDVLFVGTLTDYKRPLKLIDRQRELISRLGKVPHIIAIGSKSADDSESIVRTLEAAGITVMSEIPYPQLAKLYARAKELYIPSYHYGGGERAVLEARAMKVPFIHVEPDNEKLEQLRDGIFMDEGYYGKQLQKAVESLQSCAHLRDITTTLTFMDRSQALLDVQWRNQAAVEEEEIVSFRLCFTMESYKQCFPARPPLVVQLDIRHALCLFDRQDVRLKISTFLEGHLESKMPCRKKSKEVVEFELPESPVVLCSNSSNLFTIV
eukprot:g80.t1